MLLPDEFVEPFRPHPRGQRLRFAAVRFFGVVKEGHDVSIQFPVHGLQWTIGFNCLL
jgi:hypothetical protein